MHNENPSKSDHNEKRIHLCHQYLQNLNMKQIAVHYSEIDRKLILSITVIAFINRTWGIIAATDLALATGS